MSIKKFINMQIVKIKRAAAVGSLILLILNFTLNFYPYIEHRGIHPYIGISLVFLLMFLLVWIIAHFYIRYLEMYKHEAVAEKHYNPYAVYLFGPFEEMMYRNVSIPMFEAIYTSMKNGKEKQIFRKQIDQLKGWIELGYIPKSDFPDHLKKYYLTKNEGRM